MDVDSDDECSRPMSGRKAAVNTTGLYVEVLHKQLDTHVSGGFSLQTTRLSAADSSTWFAASGNNVRCLQPIFDPSVKFKQGTQGPSVSAPERFDLSVSTAVTDGSAHLTELQSVDSLPVDSGYLVAAVDALGRASTSFVRRDIADAESKELPSVSRDSSRSSVLAPPVPVESGWTGVSLNTAAPQRCAVASYFGKSAWIFEEGKCTRQLYTQLNPTAIKFVNIPGSNAPVLAGLEGNLLTIWDLRSSERGSLAQRLSVSSSSLFSLSCHSSGVLAAGGVDKTVYVFDTRKWSAIGQWKKVMKYEVIGLHLSLADPSMCYVAGLDHEVTCGYWKSGAKHKGQNASKLKREGFRGDTRWVGLDIVAGVGGGREALVGLTESGMVYCLREPWRMHVDSLPSDQ